MYINNKEAYEEYNENLVELTESVDNLYRLIMKEDMVTAISVHNQIMLEYGYFDEFLTEGKVSNAVGKVVRGVKRTGKASDAIIDKSMDKIRKALVGGTRDEIMANNIKFSKILRTIIVGGLTFAISPAIAVIGVLTKVSVGKVLNVRERERIIADLTRELEICEEKIKDADSDGNKKEKYELMRLRNEMKRSIERVKHGNLVAK